MKPKNYPMSYKRQRMSNHHSVVLPGISSYSKVQSHELKAFDVPPVVSRPDVVATPPTLIAEIKTEMKNSDVEKFPIQLLQIPVGIDEILQEINIDDDDGNSSDPSE